MRHKPRDGGTRSVHDLASPDGIAGVRAPAKSLKSKKHRGQSWDRSHLLTVPRGMVREPALARSNAW
jgi:hypothetical protein